MEKFKKFFLWSFLTKTNVSIWAMVFVVMNMFFAFLNGERAMDYVEILEILGVSTVIGLLYQGMLDGRNDLSVFSGKCVVWMALTFASVNVGIFLFGWVSGTIFIAIYDFLMVLGIFAMVIGTIWRGEGL
ncbi:MAG: hypothetical protein R3Y65_08050 [Bacillota bacterium]